MVEIPEYRNDHTRCKHWQGHGQEDLVSETCEEQDAYAERRRCSGAVVFTLIGISALWRAYDGALSCLCRAKAIPVWAEGIQTMNQVPAQLEAKDSPTQ